MHERIENRGFRKWSSHSLMIFTIEQGESEHGKGAVSHVLGSHEVSIQSNDPLCGAIHIRGREYLRLLRDALTKICEIEDID